MCTPVPRFQVCNRGIVWHKKHFPSTFKFFFIKGEGKETLMVPLGEAIQNYLPGQCPVEHGQRGQADTRLPLLLGLQISSC